MTQLKESRQKLFSYLLAISVLCLYLFPSLFVGATESILGHLLRPGTQSAIYCLFRIAAAILFYLCLELVSGQPGCIRSGILPYYTFLMLLIISSHVILSAFSINLTMLWSYNHGLVIARLAVIIFSTILLVLYGHWTFCVFFVSSEMKFRTSVAELFRHIPRFFGILLSYVFLLVGTAARDLISVVAVGRGWFSAHLVYFVYSLLCWKILNVLILHVSCHQYSSVSLSNQRPKREGSYIAPAIAAAVCGVIAVFFILGSRFPSRKDLLFGQVNNYLEKGNCDFVQGKIDSSITEYRTASQILEVTLKNSGAEEEFSYSGFDRPKSPLAAYLYLLSGDLSCEELERDIQTGQKGIEWYPALLEYYSSCEELTREQTSLEKEMLKSCISAQYARTFPEQTWIQDHAFEVQSEIRNYMESLIQMRAVQHLNAVSKAGGATKDIVNAALDDAEANPGEALLQYTAYTLGADYQVDDAKHYGRTVEAAIRYDQLMDSVTMDDPVRASLKSSVANAAFDCYRYEEAASYYEQAYNLSKEPVYLLYAAGSCEKADLKEKCIQYAETLLKEEPENAEALYLVCMCSIKTQDYDRAISAAGSIADMIQNSREAVNETDQLLYSCAQYMAMSDSSRWTDYTYAFFDNMTEEQRLAAGRHPILWSYLSAINNCFMKKDNNAAIDDLNGILSVREDLPMCWYLKGVCSSNLEDYPAAENELKQANKLQPNIPSVMYSLANVEDALGNYTEAYEWCQRVKAVLPEQDHGNDYYGIAIHNGRLMSALEKEIKK